MTNQMRNSLETVKTGWVDAKILKVDANVVTLNSVLKVINYFYGN